MLAWLWISAVLVAFGAPVQIPTIRTTTRQVLVPVVVTDRSGHYVTDLKRTDFEVFEDGVAQEIVGFNLRTSPPGAVAGPANRLLTSAPALPANSKQQESDAPSRTYLICIDTLHSSFANFGRAREALRKLFRSEQDSDSQYALIALGQTARVLADSTRNPKDILAVLEAKKALKLIGDSEAGNLNRDAQEFSYFMRDDYCARCVCGRSDPKAPDSGGCFAARERLRGFLMRSGGRTAVLNQNFLAGLQQLVLSTASMPTARTIIFLSDGFNRYPGRELYAIMQGYAPRDRTFEFNPQDTDSFLRPVLKAAARYDVKFYTLDSRGLYTSTTVSGSTFDASFGEGAFVPQAVDSNNMTVAHENTDALAELAHATGGLFFENNNDLLKGLRRAFADGREWYVLAYAPSNRAVDGSYRKIRVEVKGKRLLVQAKAGYWATQ